LNICSCNIGMSESLVTTLDKANTTASSRIRYFYISKCWHFLWLKFSLDSHHTTNNDHCAEEIAHGISASLQRMAK